MNLLQPFILMRLTAGLAAALLFSLTAVVSLRILRHAHLLQATEGQLALERQGELAGALAKVGSVVQVLLLLLSALSADRLATDLRGAMCGYGVVTANAWGWPALGATATTSLAAGVLLQLFALDHRIHGLHLLKPIAAFSLLLAPLSWIDFSLTTGWLMNLDLTVVASCCSSGLDGAAPRGGGYLDGPRALATWGSLVGVPTVIAMAAFAARRPSRALVLVVGAATLAVAPLALGASVLEVAPHVYEVPGHLCPFCLLRTDAHLLGYPLFGAIFLAVVWGVGTAIAAMVAHRAPTFTAFAAFARSRMIREAFAWGAALLLGSIPVIAYELASGGASLFR